MLDFIEIHEAYKMSSSKLLKVIEADYLTYNVKDIMIRGNDFYAVWDEENKVWSRDENVAIKLIDKELKKYYDEHNDGVPCVVRYLKYSANKAIDQFKKYCQKQMVDSWHQLDSTLVFNNDELSRDLYSTKKLSYSLEEGSTDAYDELIGTLYSDEERQKIEWCIGSIINGDSKWIQKFAIIFGDAGTGKGTVLKIVRKLFDGYYGTLDAKALGSSGSAFALEPLKANPLVAIQDDTNLSKIEDNTRLNSLVSHEPLVVNEKRKSMYELSFQSFIFLGSNSEVKITDSRSGLLRRIIDITPTGNKVPTLRYVELVNKINFELGAIAYKCLKVYEDNKHLYDGYFPVRMIRATNSFYNFVEDNWRDLLGDGDSVKLGDAWNRYKMYCDMASVPYPYSLQMFKNEFKNYFREFVLEGRDENGGHVRSLFSGFKFDKIGMKNKEESLTVDDKDWLIFKEPEEDTVFDILGSAFPAQYAYSDDGGPVTSWAANTKSLKDIIPTRTHYVKVPENYIMADFDKKDPITGEKSLELNLEAARKWPKTYGELSKSGKGIHLIYIYNGNIDDLEKLFEPDVEVKTFKGGASMRRKLTRCCNNPIATINSGLPLKKGDKKVVDEFVLTNEKAIRTMIENNLRKVYHPGTKPSVDYIYKILEDAYEDSQRPNGIKYDVRDLRQKVLAFANNSTHQSDYCVKLVGKMHFCSSEDENGLASDMMLTGGVSDEDYNNAPIAFYDVEVFPNLFVVVYKFVGEDCKILINPTSAQVTELTKLRLIGFNCRRYDNHILYARMLGYSNQQLYNLSQKIVSDSKNCMFHEAYNLSYTDVYDFSSAVNKKGLKKWEIELGIHHLELGLPWDQPVPEDMFEKVGEYCCNDVISTEIVFNHLKSDWTARQILSDLSGLSVNDTTNQHSTKIIFGDNRHPQTEFMYRDLSKPVTWIPDEMKKFLWRKFPEMMKWWSENTDSLLPYFPGYVFDHGKSYYKGIEVGEGGYVEADPGMYGFTGLFDVASMHPHSMLTEWIFGPYTQYLDDLVDGRITIKHTAFSELDHILDGKLKPYIGMLENGDISAKDLSNALKTVINSIYGLTSAKFENAFRDIRNKDNIVAKRGALFMIDLSEAVKEKGWHVAHIKTDSIKIPDATEEVWDFIREFGKRYGYTFEWEATYDKMCLVNDAVYIARYRNEDGSVGEWTATGAQFAEPYIFKSLFTHEDISFDDYCQTKSVSTSMYLDMNENLGEDEHNYIFVGKVGSFVPVKSGLGGGQLLREKDGKYYAVGGTKGYRWLESEVFSKTMNTDDIDMMYYIKMSDDAIAKIEEFGSFSWLVDPAPYNCTVPYGSKPGDYISETFMNLPVEDDDEVPWDETVVDNGATQSNI